MRGDQNVIKWMRIEKVEQMQNPSGNIKISYLLKYILLHYSLK